MNTNMEDGYYREYDEITREMTQFRVEKGVITRIHDDGTETVIKPAPKPKDGAVKKLEIN